MKTKKPLGPCSFYKEGQVFHYENFPSRGEPEGFCDIAWNAIWPHAMALGHHGDFGYYYEESDIMVICCPDGLRPVIFKLERMENVKNKHELTQ